MCVLFIMWVCASLQVYYCKLRLSTSTVCLCEVSISNSMSLPPEHFIFSPTKRRLSLSSLWLPHPAFIQFLILTFTAHVHWFMHYIYNNMPDTPFISRSTVTYFITIFSIPPHLFFWMPLYLLAVANIVNVCVFYLIMFILSLTGCIIIHSPFQLFSNDHYIKSIMLLTLPFFWFNIIRLLCHDLKNRNFLPINYIYKKAIVLLK